MKRSNTLSLGDAVNEFIAENRIGRKLKEINLAHEWESLLGKTINRYTRSIRIENGILYADITSAVVKNELFMMREEISRRLNEKAGEVLIRKIVFK